ncbi:MFS transporter [Prosthecomicrobium sp. N25]|uniref:MFS transporter n=1 Tax=Prosthecomicrobium sp. N25 TaxID=3129254 RepID=UPI003076E01A
MSYGPSLDWLNFLLADVRGGLGPYVSVYLLTEANWDQATIGAVLTASGLVGITLHTPMGMIIDATRSKRALIVAGVAALSVCALAIAWRPSVPVVLAADIVMAALGGLFAPTVAAITLGLSGPGELAARIGRNVAFDRLGNLAVAALAAAVGTAVSLTAVFYLVPFFAVLTTVAILSIPASAIDHERARGLDSKAAAERPGPPAGWFKLLTYRPFLLLAAVTILFHFANAPMLALASQKLALSHPGREAALTSSAIIVAQLATIPMALLVGQADILGRKPLLVLAFLALPARGLLFSYADGAAWIIAGQVLDGIGSGLFDTLLPLVLSDIMRGSGRYNASRGIIGTIQGVGGSSSHVFAGAMVVGVGYGWAFMALAGIAACALVLVVLAMPETKPKDA